MKILAGSEGYDPTAMCATDSRETLGENDALGSIVVNRSQRGHNSLVANSAELTRNAPIVLENRLPAGGLDQARYPGELTDSRDLVTESRNNRTDMMNRTSSRFSKGHDKELDRLAERINNSVLLSHKSKEEPDEGIVDEDEEDDEDITVHNKGVRDSSSELPKSVIRNKLKRAAASNKTYADSAAVE